MAYTNKKFGDYTVRRSYSKTDNAIELKDLLEIQKKSYNEFITEGIKEVFDDIFPVESFTGNLKLEFGEYSLDEPRHSIKECKERYSTYAAPLNVEARLFNQETGEVKEQKVYLGDMPIMTETGTFIINGAERVIVSQLVRSPSVYFSREIDKKNGKSIIKSQIIPTRGTWLEYEPDARDVIYVRIDRTRKVPVTTLLRALGLSNDEDILDLYGENDSLVKTIEKDVNKNTDESLIDIHSKLRPGEPSTLESAQNQLITRFFDSFRYDLAKVGRYKFNKKLNVAERLYNCTLAEDIKVGKEVILPKDTLLTKENMEILKPILKDGYGVVETTINTDLDSYNKVQIIKVYSKNDKNKVVKVIGNDQTITEKRLTISDVYASVSYYLNLLDGIGSYDEIDHLSNRRVRQVGELLQNQFRIGISRIERVIRDRMSTQDVGEVSPKSLINIRPLTAAMKEFFGSSQLSQFMDQVNPIAELANKRRLSSLGPGGLSRDRAGMEVRDVNVSHYGRLCPIESPEGPNIGLITSLASFAKVNEYGFIMTPYRKVVDCKLTDEIVYMTADEELEHYISQATVKVDDDNKIIDDRVPVRFYGENIIIEKEKVDFADVSAQQVVSITTSLIPFLENDDTARALMGANMQRQAVPLITTEAPIIGTGMEHKIAVDNGAVIVSDCNGTVKYVDGNKIILVSDEGEQFEYELIKFVKTNQESCINQKPIVKKGQKVRKGEVIADGYSTSGGELALGKNMLIAFMNWEGYNYEDAILLSERLVKEDVYTSITLKEEEVKCRTTKLGDEEFTRDIPNLGDDVLKNLDENGIIRIGAEVKPGDILVGKVTPKGETEPTPEERLLRAIFGEKARDVKDTSLRVPHGISGVVVDIQVFSRKNKDELETGVNQMVRVTIAQKRKISVGDKMAGRHGNKGIVSRILPVEDMPFMANGQPIDIVLNPLGIPSRMNVGQVLEVHLGLVAKALGIKIATPVFDGVNEADIRELLKENNFPENGKIQLYDGRTGEPFENPVTVGYMYYIKLEHMVNDKMHARSTGPYAYVTQQPLGGKAMFGGQRFGEMEVWALEAYGATKLLQEMLTVKSDDTEGRLATYKAIVEGLPLPEPGMPESFKVLIRELQGLGLDVQLRNDQGKEFALGDLNSDTVETFAEATKPREEVKDIELDFDAPTPETALEENLESDEDFDNIFDESDLFDDFDEEE